MDTFSDVCPMALPTRRQDPSQPPAEYTGLRKGPPTRVRLPDGSQPWLMSRYDDVRAVLSDARFSADDTHPSYPRLFPLPPERGALSFFRYDDPEHGRLRRMVTSEFTARRVNEMRPGIQQVVDDLLDRMTGRTPPADLIQEFVLPLPSLVFAQLVGVPYEDYDMFVTGVDALVSVNLTEEQAARAFQDLADYLDRLTTAKERHPTGDVLGRLAETRVNTGELTHDELVRIARVLLIGGHETTVGTTGLAVLELLRHPDQLARLRADTSLVKPAIEELLRHLTVTHHGICRVAKEPVEVGGVTVDSDEGVIVSLLSANHDTDHFPGAEELDLDRVPKHHVTFGFGPHQCLGQSLARAEMEIALVNLIERLPDLALAGDGLAGLSFRDDKVIYGIDELPVTW